jgi:hypothetical protein
MYARPSGRFRDVQTQHLFPCTHKSAGDGQRFTVMCGMLLEVTARREKEAIIAFVSQSVQDEI